MKHTFCPSYSVALTAENNGNYKIYKPRCKRWSCKYCAIENRKIWRGRIMSEIESTPAIKTWYFWTLTLVGKDHNGLLHSLDVWREAWHKLRKRIVRALGKLRYVRIFEMHKDGTLHIHMLADKTYDDIETIPARGKAKKRHESPKLRQQLIKLGLGYIHDIKPITTENIEENGIARNISAYAVKYMTKDSMSFARLTIKESGSTLRLISTSHKFYNKNDKDTDDIWLKNPLFKTSYLAMPPKKTAKDISTDRKVTIDDFHGYDHYPNRTSDLIDIADMLD